MYSKPQQHWAERACKTTTSHMPAFVFLGLIACTTITGPSLLLLHNRDLGRVAGIGTKRFAKEAQPSSPCLSPSFSYHFPFSGQLLCSFPQTTIPRLWPEVRPPLSLNLASFPQIPRPQLLRFMDLCYLPLSHGSQSAMNFGPLFPPNVCLSAWQHRDIPFACLCLSCIRSL